MRPLAAHIQETLASHVKRWETVVANLSNIGSVELTGDEYASQLTMEQIIKNREFVMQKLPEVKAVIADMAIKPNKRAIFAASRDFLDEWHNAVSSIKNALPLLDDAVASNLLPNIDVAPLLAMGEIIGFYYNEPGREADFDFARVLAECSEVRLAAEVTASAMRNSISLGIVRGETEIARHFERLAGDCRPVWVAYTKLHIADRLAPVFSLALGTPIAPSQRLWDARTRLEYDIQETVKAASLAQGTATHVD